MVWRNRSQNLLIGRVKIGFPFQHGVKALNGSDNNLCGGVDGITFKSLDGVQQRWKRACVVRRREVGEFILGLLAQIPAINKEENAFGPTEFKQAISDIDSGVRLA